MAITHVEPEVFDLGNGIEFYHPDGTVDSGGSRAIRARLFGVLAAKTCRHIEAYHSDLYHDAMWLHDYVDGPTTFFFGVRPTGTHVGTDCLLVHRHSDWCWKVDLQKGGTHGNRWIVTLVSLGAGEGVA